MIERRKRTNLLRQPLHQSLNSDLVDESLGDSLLEHGLRGLDLLVKDALLELDLKSVETTRELITEQRTSDGSLLRGRKSVGERLRGQCEHSKEDEDRRRRDETKGKLTRRTYSDQIASNSSLPFSQILAWMSLT